MTYNYSAIQDVIKVLEDSGDDHVRAAHYALVKMCSRRETVR